MWVTLGFLLLVAGLWDIYHGQFEVLPVAVIGCLVGWLIGRTEQH